MNEKSNKLGWLVPAVIVAAIAVAVAALWGSLAETLPAHFDLEGNAGGTMSKTTLLFYPLAGLIICLIAFGISRRTSRKALKGNLLILTSGIELIILSSVMVTLTKGSTPVFMLAEPVILAITVVVCIIYIIKERKSR
jgi:FtsH-binding integral membrane protein